MRRNTIRKAGANLFAKGIPIALIGAFAMSIAWKAQAVSSWNPTLLVNTESFQEIDDGDGTTDRELRFGDIDKKLMWQINANRFQFTRNVNIGGNLTATGSIAASGSLTIEGAMSGASLNVSGKTTMSGALSLEGAASIQGALTLGVGATNFVFPTTRGTDGQILKTDASGNVTWQADTDTNAQTMCATDQFLDGDGNCVDVITETELDSESELETQLGNLNVYTRNDGELFSSTGALRSYFDSRYVNTSGDTMTGALKVRANMSGATLRVDNNADIWGTLGVSGATVMDGTVNIKGALTLGDGGTTFVLPTSRGSNGQVLKTDASGNVTWQTDSGGGTGSGGVVFLGPEYPHAVYFNSGSVANSIGQLSYDYDETNKENYYRWDTTKSTLQEYWISARIRIPDNFSQWDDSRPIQLRYRTGSGLTTANFISMRLYDTAGTEIALTGANKLANTSWTTAAITGPESTGTYTKSSYITVAVKLAGTNPADTSDDGWVDAGFINLNFETTAP